MADLDTTLNGFVLRGFARAGHIVHVHAKRVPDTVREERAGDTRCEDRLLGVPRAGVGRFRRVEDAELLEAAHERAVADVLDGVPVKVGFDLLKGLLRYTSGKKSFSVNRTHLLHLEHEIIYRPGLWCELATISYGHRARDYGGQSKCMLKGRAYGALTVAGVAVPFTPSIDKKHLRNKLLVPSSVLCWMRMTEASVV